MCNFSATSKLAETREFPGHVLLYTACNFIHVDIGSSSSSIVCLSLSSKLGKHLRSTTTCMYKYAFCVITPQNVGFAHKVP